MKNNQPVIKAIVLAGGSSQRMKTRLPKQLIKIEQKPLLSYTLDVFESCRAINSIILVVYRKYIQEFRKLVKKYHYKKIEQFCFGGRTRQQSVFNALKKIGDCDYVVIHDGVRPLVNTKIIQRIVQQAKRFGAVTCAVKSIDTMVEAKNDFIYRILKRHNLWQVQTPQAFRFDLILTAHQKAKTKKIVNASDDAQLVLKLGKAVKLIRGSCQNIKVTTKSDLTLFRELKNSQR